MMSFFKRFYFLIFGIVFVLSIFIVYAEDVPYYDSTELPITDNLLEPEDADTEKDESPIESYESSETEIDETSDTEESTKSSETETDKPVNTENTTTQSGTSESDETLDTSAKTSDELSSKNKASKLPKILYNETHFFVKGVSAISVHSNASTADKIYFAGNDGYITSFSYPDFLADTWQVSKLAIKAIASHPTLPYLAVYVTDELNKNELSVWNWNTKNLLYTLKFDNNIVSLSWSARGNYLFVGNTSTNGINVFDIHGNECDVFVTQPGIVHLAATGSSEKSVVTYDETGNLTYTNLKTKKLPTLFTTESRLQNPIALKNYTLFAGYKNNKVFLIDALSGKTVQTYLANKPIFATRITDKIPIWVEATSKNTYCIRQGNTKTPDFQFADEITVAAHLGGIIFVGTKEGRLYIIQQKNDKSVVVRKIQEPNFTPIKNIQGFQNKIYALTDTAIYYANEAGGDFKLLKNFLSVNINPDRITVCKSGIFLWTFDSKSPIYFYSFESDRLKLFTRPSNGVLGLSCYERNCLIVLKFYGLQIFDMETGKLQLKYEVEGIQSATQVDANNVLIAKNTLESFQPIYMLNITTKETLPFPIEGFFSYGITRNILNPQEVHCFVVEQKNYETLTIMYEIKINTKKPLASTVKKVIALKGEKLNSFVEAHDKNIITNLGSALIGTKSGKYFELPRSYSFSTDGTFTNKFFFALNCDGTISVYDAQLNFISIKKLTH